MYNTLRNLATSRRVSSSHPALGGSTRITPSVSAFVNHSLATLSVSSREKTSAGAL